MKFKVGDTLRHHKCLNTGCSYLGCEFEVTNAEELDGAIWYDSDGATFAEDEVELVKEAQ